MKFKNLIPKKRMEKNHCHEHVYKVARRQMQNSFTTLNPSDLTKKLVFGRNNRQDLFNMLALMFTSTMFLRIIKDSSVQPIITVGTNVLSRETFAGMYSSW